MSYRLDSMPEDLKGWLLQKNGRRHMLYEGIALDLDERDRLVRDLGDNNAMILRHHGLLTTGRTVGDAFYEMYYLEQACRLQIAATQGGQKLVVPPDSVAEHAAQQLESFESKGQRPWAAQAAPRPRKPRLRDLMCGAPDLQVRALVN